MIHVSLTRLRLRSVRFVPVFFVYAIRSNRQVARSAGFLTGQLLNDRKWTFWTMTAWESPEAMRAYMISGAHKAALPKLLHWCDEASVAHWEQETSVLPSWEEAEQRMRTTGRVSKVLHPSANHVGMKFEAARTTQVGPIHPQKP